VAMAAINLMTNAKEHLVFLLCKDSSDGNSRRDCIMTGIPFDLRL
jgi:hypothetical protein